jgi:hypothetical protein
VAQFATRQLYYSVDISILTFKVIAGRCLIEFGLLSISFRLDVEQGCTPSALLLVFRWHCSLFLFLFLFLSLLLSQSSSQLPAFGFMTLQYRRPRLLKSFIDATVYPTPLAVPRSKELSARVPQAQHDLFPFSSKYAHLFHRILGLVY